MFKSSYNCYTLTNLVGTSQSAIDFLQSKNILHKSAQCKKCGWSNSTVLKKPDTNYYYFPCDNCDSSMTSIRDNTLLQYKHVPLRTFCLLAYTFVMCLGLSNAQKIHEVSMKY